RGDRRHGRRVAGRAGRVRTREDGPVIGFGGVGRVTAGWKETNVLRILMTGLLLCVSGVRLAAPEARPPQWDARGVGPLPRMGITSLDVSDDGTEIVVGTIAPFGDPNVIVLSDAGKVVRHYQVGQQWIDAVAFVAGTRDVLAVCTM